MLVVDAENVLDSSDVAPDKLRALVGQYYTRVLGVGALISRNLNEGQIDYEFEHIEPNEQVLIPTKRSRIHIKGNISRFRDHTQWNSFIDGTVTLNRQFLDHTFDFTPPTVTNSFHKNFHHPEYEDATKTYPSNQLLNYNLISYPYKDEVENVRNIGDLRTRFDSINPRVNNLLNEFASRITNYTGSVGEIVAKQRNIFDLEPNEVAESIDGFPYYHEKTFDIDPRGGNPGLLNPFVRNLVQYKKEKNLFQMLKKDLSFSSRSFIVGGDQVSGKIYNAISLLTSTSINRFQEASDELFLYRGNDTNSNDPSERFINQVNSVRFLSSMRRSILNQSRDLEDVFGNQRCSSFVLGYKVEKYLDNSSTQPIQTYYTTGDRLVDTQLKYGRRYIYKTKVLVGIFGSSYSYSNLVVSQSEAEATTSSSPYMGEKYWAHVDVELVPSFRILEYEIDVHESAFIDFPTLPPHVSFYCRRDEGAIQMYFRPRFFTMSDAQGAVVLTSVGNLRPEDENIANLADISGERIANPDYFTGIYEIYRMNKPPDFSGEFANYYLTTVDDKTGLIRPTQNMPHVVYDNMNGYFADRIIPNQKYYYAFRALTYHGTPSQLTHPFEVELIKDSDEYKISVKEYHYPKSSDYVFRKNVKRLIKIAPNIERLLFSDETDRNNWQLDEGSLVANGAGLNDNRTFKIRVTSKHTGKKMDINVTFKLKKDDSFTNPQQN